MASARRFGRVAGRHGVRTCQSPGGVWRSTGTQWQGLLTGQDSEGDRWTTSRWQGFDPTTVRSPER